MATSTADRLLDYCDRIQAESMINDSVTETNQSINLCVSQMYRQTPISEARLSRHLCTARIQDAASITNIPTQPAYPKLHLPRSPISLQPAVDQATKKESSPLICQEMRRDFVCAGSTSRFGHSARPSRIAAFDKRSLSTR